MSSSTQPPLKRYTLWLSLVLAAIPAVILPVKWISWSDRNAFRVSILNFHILAALIYIPLAFGLIWPVLIGIQAIAMRSARQARLRRFRIAPIMFIVSAGCSAPFIRREYRSFIEDREVVFAAGRRRVQDQLQQEQNAVQAIRANGVAALNEPLTEPQVEAVNSYIDYHATSPLDLQSASQHYRTSVDVMSNIATKRICPPDVLETFFENAINLQKDPVNGWRASYVFINIARNPNAPVALLGKLLESDDEGVRTAAAANPTLPKAAKIAYLKRASVSRSFPERAAAAQDPDCPPEALKQLALDPALSFSVASNPSTPADLLQTLADSGIWRTRKRALANLADREKTKQ